MEQFLTIKEVASIMRTVLAGELSRVHARRLVEPWVEGDAEGFEHGALSGATVIHGIDLVRDPQTRTVWHSSDDADVEFAMSDDEMRTAFNDWARRFAGPTEF